jgi:hypothetical protein
MLDKTAVIALADDDDSPRRGNNNCCLASSSSISGCGRASGDESSITERSGVRFTSADSSHEQPSNARPGFDLERLLI